MSTTKRKPTRRFVFRGEVEAENIDHAMLSLAADLVKVRAELAADETGYVGEVWSMTMKPQRRRS